MSEEINILVEKEKLKFCRLIVIKFEFQTILAVDHIQIFDFFFLLVSVYFTLHLLKNQPLPEKWRRK